MTVFPYPAQVKGGHPMKSTKDMVFEYVRQYVYTGTAGHTEGVETHTIAQALGKQRSNISAALNDLIKEGKLIKTSTRPVLYRLPEPVTEPGKDTGAGIVVGINGSLRSAFQQAKAAIRYPRNPLSILISAKSGCGTSFFVNAIHRYGVQNAVLRADVPLVKVNCRYYAKNIAALDDELFGTGSGENSCFERARGGMLFIDSFDLLDARQQSRVFAFLDTKTLSFDNGKKIKYSDVYLALSCSGQNLPLLKQKMAITIELPELADRPMEERFELINRFFIQETQNLKRHIQVSAEAIKTLLVTRFSYNVKELRNEVLKACMNAFAREEGEADHTLHVGINDFGAAIRRNLLELKNHAAELEQFLGQRTSFLYDMERGYRAAESRPRPGSPVQEPTGGARPVVLYAMHGKGTATSLSAVTNALSSEENCYGYDMDLEIDAKTAKEELKSLLLRIDRGAGVLVIYDMGSIKTIVDAIVEETDRKFCCLHMPITLIGIDAAQKCRDEGDIYTVYHSIRKELNDRRYHNFPSKNVIITLCHTGDDGARYLKEYIDRHSRLNIKTIALNITGRKLLLKEAMELKRSYNIHAFVGTYDPKLLGIPFISSAALLNVEPENVDRVLMFEPVSLPTADYSQVYEYLQDELKFTSVAKLKQVLPKVVDELMVMYDLEADRMQGMFIHLACVVERLLSGGKTNPIPQARQLADALPDDYRAVAKTLRPLERMFRIIIDDNAISTLLMMLKKL